MMWCCVCFPPSVHVHLSQFANVALPFPPTLQRSEAVLLAHARCWLTRPNSALRAPWRAGRRGAAAHNLKRSPLPPSSSRLRLRLRLHHHGCSRFLFLLRCAQQRAYRYDVGRAIGTCDSATAAPPQRHRSAAAPQGPRRPPLLRSAHCAHRARPRPRRALCSPCARCSYRVLPSQLRQRSDRDQFMLPRGLASCRIVGAPDELSIRRVSTIVQHRADGQRRVAVDHSRAATVVGLEVGTPFELGKPSLHSVKFKQHASYCNDASFDHMAVGFQLVRHTHSDAAQRRGAQRERCACDRSSCFPVLHRLLRLLLQPAVHIHVQFLAEEHCAKPDTICNSSIHTESVIVAIDSELGRQWRDEQKAGQSLAPACARWGTPGTRATQPRAHTLFLSLCVCCMCRRTGPRRGLGGGRGIIVPPQLRRRSLPACAPAKHVQVQRADDRYIGRYHQDPRLVSAAQQQRQQQRHDRSLCSFPLPRSFFFVPL